MTFGFLNLRFNKQAITWLDCCNSVLAGLSRLTNCIVHFLLLLHFIVLCLSCLFAVAVANKDLYIWPRLFIRWVSANNTQSWWRTLDVFWRCGRLSILSVDTVKVLVLFSDDSPVKFKTHSPRPCWWTIMTRISWQSTHENTAAWVENSLYIRVYIFAKYWPMFIIDSLKRSALGLNVQFE